MAYAIPTDVLIYTDANTLGDLLADTGDPVEVTDDEPKLLEFIAAASGQVEAACEVSGLYSPEELAALTGNSQSLLKRLVCTLAVILAVQRRPEKYAAEYWQAREKWVEDYLDQLRKGQRLFADPANTKAKAGLPTVDGPSAVDYDRLNLMPDRTHNFYPARVTRLPLGRG